MAISDIILSNVEDIIKSYHANSRTLNEVIPVLRERLIAEGGIVTFDQIEASGTMIAVDGGRASEDLTSGDLMVVGAGVGEGHSTESLYTDDGPEEAWSGVLPHKSNNSDIVADIMYALELRVLHKAQADLRIIDGAYLANVSHILFALAGSSYIDSERIDTLFQAINGDADGAMRAVFQEILYPPRENNSTIVSMPKSDSDKIYTKKWLDGDDEVIDRTSDRILAGRLLHPGEMLFPRNIRSNPILIAKLSKLDTSKYDGEYRELYDEIIKDKAGLLTRLDTQKTEEGILWTTYFKPHEFDIYSKALKIEFPYYKNQNEGDAGARDHARKIVSRIDSDVIDGYILEPWCQYSADIKAKDVSNAITMLKSSLIAEATDNDEAAGLLRGYRT
jgi:hypothetical protein